MCIWTEYPLYLLIADSELLNRQLLVIIFMPRSTINYGNIHFMHTKCLQSLGLVANVQCPRDRKWYSRCINKARITGSTNCQIPDYRICQIRPDPDFPPISGASLIIKFRLYYYTDMSHVIFFVRFRPYSSPVAFHLLSHRLHTWKLKIVDGVYKSAVTGGQGDHWPPLETMGAR